MLHPIFIREIRTQCCKAHTKILRDDDHMCSQNTCTILHIPAAVYVHKAKLHGCSKHCPKFPHAPSTNYKAVHKLSNIFFCLNSSQLHVCTPKCRLHHLHTVDGQHMCRISGRIFAQELVMPLVIQYSKRAKHMYMDPYRLIRNKEMQIELQNNTLSSQSINVIHLLLFSKHRMYAEKNKLIKLRLFAKNKVLYYMKLCKLAQTPPILTDMIRIHVFFMNTRRIYKGLMPTECVQKQLKYKYSRRCQTLWKALCKYSFIKQHLHNMKYFHIFVASSLYIMKSGLPMNNVQIIPRDNYLESSLPEANQLDFYSIPKHSFTSVKNDIQRAIRNIIKERKISPHILALE